MRQRLEKPFASIVTGTLAAPSTEPSETYLVSATVSAKTTSAISAASESTTNTADTPTRMPLPPRRP